MDLKYFPDPLKLFGFFELFSLKMGKYFQFKKINFDRSLGGFQRFFGFF